MISSGVFTATVRALGRAPVGDVDGDIETEGVPEQVRIPATMARRVAAVDGVRAVVPARSLPTTVATLGGRVLSPPDSGTVSGHGWSSAALTPYRLTAGRAPSTAGEVALDRTFAAQGNLQLGDGVRITSTDGTRTYAVVGLAVPPEGRDWLGTVFLTDARALTSTALQANGCRGWSIGVYNPDLDPENREAQRIVAYLAEVTGRRARGG